jgi:hypothetical protein
MPPTRYRATEVFTPGAYPELTYVARQGASAEQNLRDALATKGQIASVIGPSKSGKTVLVEKVVGADSLIPISGAILRAPEDLWGRALDWMKLPTSIVAADERTTTKRAEVEAGGSVGIPLVAKGEAKAKGSLEASASTTDQQVFYRGGLQQVIREIGDSDFVILLDDFHYVDRGIQAKIAQECKEGARQGLKIVVASVPHREDDVIRANPDLRGRVVSIDLHYWNISELEEIAYKGFSKLNASVSAPTVNRFAAEAAGSPQLMQAICLSSCFELNMRETFDIPTTVEPDEEGFERVFSRTAAMTSYASLIDVLRRGPKERGRDRLTFNLKTGGEGDVYECILRAMRADPARLALPYPDLKDRIEGLCVGDAPRGVAIANSVASMVKIADQLPLERAIDWDEEREVLDIVDPYFLFYLRWSDKF